MNLLVIGPQGAGKGTQAKRISSEYQLPHISTGDMFREAVAGRTFLGGQVEPILARGDLVPDDLTVALIRERLTAPDAAAGFVLDGFPRNLAQAEALDSMLVSIGRRLDAVLFFDLPDEVAMQRMKYRATVEGRADDTPGAMARRLAVYHEQTEPVVEYYRSTGKLVPLHGDRTIDEVYREVQQALDQVEEHRRAG
jgi:adenylate kinase